jgi:acyl-coenzyme A synthetase/AMP-(fatty) acid ligase
LIEAAARKHAKRPALIGAGIELSHARLDACVARAAAALEKQGVKPGDIVGVSMGTSPLHLVTLLAISRAGAGSVHVRPDLPQVEKNAIAKQFEVVTVLTGDPSWLEPARAVKHQSKAQPGSPWRIQLSSGTTGLQKAVLVSQRQIAGFLGQYAGLLPRERFLSHRGMDAMFSLNHVMSHLVKGGAVVFPASLSMDHFVEAVDRHKVTGVAMSPAFVADLVARLQRETCRLPGLRYLMVGGSPMRPQLLRTAWQCLTPSIHFGYGSTEIGNLASADPVTLARAPLTAGRLYPWVEAQVGKDGELGFRHPFMPTEYHRNPEATAKSFRDGWFFPGDIGRIDPEGLLYIEGRVDDKLNLDGVKVEPAPIERALEEHPAVVEAAAFAAAPDGRSHLYAAAVLRQPVHEKALLEHCRSRLGKTSTPSRVFFVKALPRNEGGKVMRSQLSERVKRKAKA